MSDFIVTVTGNDSISVGSLDSANAVVQGYPTDQIEAYVFSFGGYLRTYTGTGRLYLEGPYSISNIRLTVGTLADRDVIVDLKKNGTSIYTTKPRIPAGEYTALANNYLSTSTFVKGDYLTLDIVQSGLTLTGAELTATIRLKRLY
jgi:hypothetical protein